MKTKDALQQIAEKNFIDKLYQFSYRRCDTSHEAEDLCSDIILAVISAMSRQENIDHFHAFVWTIAHRVYADFSEKRNKAKNTISIENAAFSFFSEEDEIEKFIEETEAEQNLKKILAEISFLSKSYREVMVLYYMDGLKVAEIAGRLHISETTVKQRLFSARNTVRKEVNTMNNRNLSLKPIQLTFIGTGNPIGNDPRSKAERTFSQNLIYLCKDKPKTAKDLSEELCVPMPYIEEELEIQCYGENGSYGMLRKLDNGKYITNILLVDYEEYDQANKIYENHLSAYCRLLKENFEKQKSSIVSFPYLSEQTNANFVLWSLISRTIWDFEKKVQNTIQQWWSKHIEPSKRPFTTVAVAYRTEQNPNFAFYGCDGIGANSVKGYKSIHISNIYGRRIDAHFHCGHNLSTDPKLLMLIDSIKGVCSNNLSEDEKEIAAKAIACGHLRKSGNLLLPQVVAFEERFADDFYNLSYSLNAGTESIAEEIARELSAFMQKHIPTHLLSEYHHYVSLIAGERILSATIEECIKEGLLTEPASRLGAEGVILTVEK